MCLLAFFSSSSSSFSSFSPWTLGPSGAPSFSGSPRPRTGRAVGPNLGTVGYSYAFAALPSPPLLRERALLSSHSCFDERERVRGREGEREGAPVSHKLPLCVPGTRESLFDVSRIIYTHAHGPFRAREN